MIATVATPRPDTALQRTPGFGVQLPGAGGDSTGSVTGCAFATESPVQPAPSPRGALLPCAPPGSGVAELGGRQAAPHAMRMRLLSFFRLRRCCGWRGSTFTSSASGFILVSGLDRRSPTQRRLATCFTTYPFTSACCLSPTSRLQPSRRLLSDDRGSHLSAGGLQAHCWHSPSRVMLQSCSLIPATIGHGFETDHAAS